MRFTGNFYSEWANARGNHSLLVALVACAVGATAGGAAMLSLVGSPVTQPGVSSIPPRAIVREIGASEAKKTLQDQPTAETPLRPGGTNEVATQTDAEHHQPEVQKKESRKLQPSCITFARTILARAIRASSFAATLQFLVRRM